VSQQFLGNGVAIAPASVHKGDHITVIYNGILSSDGAEDVILHSGYNDHWTDEFDHHLRKTNRGWETTFLVNNASTINFCFKDNANNWDNNNGNNWRIGIY